MATYYKQETYRNGSLVYVTYYDKNGNPMPAGFTPGAGDNLSLTFPPFLPKWGVFDAAIKNNTAYNNAVNSIVATLTSSIAVSSYRNAIDYLIFDGDNPNLYSLLISRWNAVPLLIPILNRPSASDITAWNAIAAANFMPFAFSSPSAQMVLI